MGNIRVHYMRFIYICGGIILAAAIAVVIFTNNINESEMKETAFNELKDVPFQVVDNSYFTDKEMEKWFLKERQEAGEYVYSTDEGTYVLLSLGAIEDNNTFLLLNGAKEDKENLIVGYDKIKVENTPDLEFQDDIRSTLIFVEGDYSDVTAVAVDQSISAETASEEESK